MEEIFLKGDKEHAFDVIKYSVRKIGVYNKVSRSIITILVLYVDDILLIKKVVLMLTSV